MALVWSKLSNSLSSKIRIDDVPLRLDYYSECHSKCMHTQIARFMGPTWGPPGNDRAQVGPMLAPGYTDNNRHTNDWNLKTYSRRCQIMAYHFWRTFLSMIPMHTRMRNFCTVNTRNTVTVEHFYKCVLTSNVYLWHTCSIKYAACC